MEVEPSNDKEEQLIRKCADLEQKFKQFELAMDPTIVDVQIAALKKIQLELMEKEVEFHHQVHAMEVEHQKYSEAANKKRYEIVNGLYTPKREDLHDPDALPDFHEDFFPLANTGIRNFWLTAFRMCPAVSGMITERDEAVLRKLQDVRCFVEDEPNPQFTLEFVFGQNDYFENEVLSKRYNMRCKVDPERLGDFYGYEIYDTVGCTIRWKEGYDLTKCPGHQEEAGNDQTKPAQSFFYFFDPKKALEIVNEEAHVHFMEMDFEIGQYIKERVIPRSVLLFMGEGLRDCQCACHGLNACPEDTTVDEESPVEVDEQ